MGQYGYAKSKEVAAETRSTGALIKLPEDNDRFLAVFTSEPFGFKQLWPDGQNSMDADSPEGQAYLAEHPAAKKDLRFRVRYGGLCLAELAGDDPKSRYPVGHAEIGQYMKPEDILAAITPAMLMEIAESHGERVWESTQAFFTSAEKAERRKLFKDHVYEVERSGKSGDTKTKYNLYAVCKVGEVPGLAEAITAATVVDLANPFPDEDDDKGKGKRQNGKSRSTSTGRAARASSGEAKAKADGVELIDKTQKKALMDLARKITAEQLVSWLARFGIAKIKLLPAAKYDEAKAALDAHFAPATAEVDPFDDD